MNDAVLQDFAEALHLANGDRAAAANLVLASALRDCRPPAATPAVADPDAALTVAEAAKRLAVAPNTVYRLVERGQLKHHRIGRTIRILPADIDEYQRLGTEATRPRSPRKYRFNL